MLGEHRVLVEIWNEIAVKLDRDVLIQYNRATGINYEDAFSLLAYAHAAKVAFGLTGAAATADEVAEFDPDEFGRRCAAIAREQIERFEHKRPPVSQRKVRKGRTQAARPWPLGFGVSPGGCGGGPP